MDETSRDVLTTNSKTLAMKIEMTEIEQLKHRLAMVKDDLDIIRKFIYSEQLDKAFERQSETADECMTNLNNIEIACDLSTDESLSWKPYSKVN